MKIALIGDSTVTDDSGWGKAFANRFCNHVEVLNFAYNGRSSKSQLPDGISTQMGRFSQLYPPG